MLPQGLLQLGIFPRLWSADVLRVSDNHGLVKTHNYPTQPTIARNTPGNPGPRVPEPLVYLFYKRLASIV